MSVNYYKRFRMEILLDRIPALVELPEPYYWVPWHSAVLDYHAQVKYLCFANELDSKIFPCLANRDGCLQLMREIAARRGFLPQATWLVGSPDGYVATIQGVVDGHRVGMIQNLGVIPAARGQGIGTALLIRSLHGFRESGMRTVTLEVTAENTGAVRLYRRVGFRRARVLYKAVEA